MKDLYVTRYEKSPVCSSEHHTAVKAKPGKFYPMSLIGNLLIHSLESAAISQ